MKNQFWIQALLVVSGALVGGIGVAMLLTPISFHASSGIALGDNVSLMNEMRAMGGGLIGAGAIAIAGGFVARLRFTAILLVGVLNLSYGGARLVSMSLDGLPAPTLLTATGLELVIGLVCLAALVMGGRPATVTA